eukprot:2387368-Rhodomonas_salina.1
MGRDRPPERDPKGVLQQSGLERAHALPEVIATRIESLFQAFAVSICDFALELLTDRLYVVLGRVMHGLPLCCRAWCGRGGRELAVEHFTLKNLPPQRGVKMGRQRGAELWTRMQGG